MHNHAQANPSDVLPAHQTRDLSCLPHPVLGRTVYLAQSDDGHSNGTTLWLGAQLLSFYLPRLRSPRRTRPRAVELGSGVGLTALVLGALGYDVLATDTPHVCNSVLRRNVAANLSHLPAAAGSIQVRELDWNDPVRTTPSDHSGERGTEGRDLLVPPFDLIISSDTLYDASLVHPFFRTVHALAAASREVEPSNPPLLLLALERRDPRLIDWALACAPVPLTRVPAKKIRKALERTGTRWDASE